MKKNLKDKLICIVSSAILCVVALCSSFASSAAETSSAPDNGVMREGLTASQVSKEMGVGLNLGNTMEAFWEDKNRPDSGAQTIGSNTPRNYETCWGAVETTKEAIKGMADAGFNTVRIPVYWGNMMENDGTFTINKDYIGRVKEIVDYCRDAGMYAVVNIHHYDEFIIRRYAVNSDPDLEGCVKTFTRLWTQIAEYFKDYSDYLVFEGYNEYLGGGSTGELPRDTAYEWTNTLNQTFVDAVRSTGGNNKERVLIASGYFTNIDKTTSSSFKMPKDTADNKLMVSVHYVDNAMYWSNKLGGDEWRRYSVSQCELLKNAFTNKGIPVFIGECSGRYQRERFASDADVASSSEALDYMLRLILDYGFTPVIWDTNANFYSRTDNKISDPDDAEVIKEIFSEKPIEYPTEAPPADEYIWTGTWQKQQKTPFTTTGGNLTAENWAGGWQMRVSGFNLSQMAEPTIEVELTGDDKVQIYSVDWNTEIANGAEPGAYAIPDKSFTELLVMTYGIEGVITRVRIYDAAAGGEDPTEAPTEEPTEPTEPTDPSTPKIGDVSGDGVISTVDVGIINSCARGVRELTPEQFALADVNGDGKVTTVDVGLVNAHAKGVSSLW